jgi:hypothetical protein
MIKKFLRKQQHKRYVRSLLNDLRWDIVNTTIVASATGWTKGVTDHLENNGALIRKYERRLKWLKF